MLLFARWPTFDQFPTQMSFEHKNRSDSVKHKTPHKRKLRYKPKPPIAIYKCIRALPRLAYRAANRT